MKNEELKKVIKIITEKYKQKWYKKLTELISKPDCFVYEYNQNKYCFEIQAIRLKDDKISICIGGEKKKIFSIGFSQYFAITPTGIIIENDPNIIF